jgi:hypothetical protein
MVVDFLQQLSTALPSTMGDVQDGLCRKKKNSRKLELRLTNRKRQLQDGYAAVAYALCLYIRHPGPQDFGYPHTALSEGIACKHLTLW